MGLTFVRASSQYAEAAGSPLGSGPVPKFAVSCWYKPSSIALGTAASVGDTDTTNYIALGMTGGGVVFFEISDGGTGADAFAGTMTNGAWHHLLGVQTSSTSRVAYLDGVAGSTETSSKTPAQLDTTTVGALMLNGTRLSFAGGSVAHFAVWADPVPDAADAAALAGGARPDTIKPGSLVFYAELDGNASPEEDLIGTLDLVWGAGGAAPSQSVDDPPVGGVVFERSVTLTATSSIATVGTFWTTFERTVTLTAASSIATSPQRDLQRSVALTGTTSIATTGAFFHVLARQAALVATASVAVAGQRDVLRSVALTAASSITTARQFIANRSVVLTAVSSIAVSGLVPTASIGRLEGRGGVSFTESSSGVSALTE